MIPSVCGCAELSSDDYLVTCPVCCSNALRYGPLGEALAQRELFEYVDGRVSVSGSLLSGSKLPDESVTEGVDPPEVDGLPF